MALAAASAGDRSPGMTGWMRIGLGLGAVAAVTLACLPFRDLADADAFTMVYLTAVMLVALRLGLAPAIAASLASVLAFNLAFVPPFGSLSALDRDAYLTFAIMLASAMSVSVLSAGAAGRIVSADRRQAETRLLLDLARNLSVARNVNDIRSALAVLSADPVGLMLSLDLLPEGTEKPAGAGQDAGLERAIALSGEAAGSAVLSARAARGAAVRPDPDLFDVIAALVDGTLARIEKAESAARNAAERETEKTRNLLLASLGHDLRTPLTVLSGTVASLVRMRKRLPRDAMDAVTELSGQVARLQKFTANLLKVAAIAGGQLRLNRQPYAIQEIIGVALARMEELRGERRITTIVAGDLPLVDIDGALVEQVMSNLVENAIHHTQETGTIVIRMERAGDRVIVSVADDGTGLGPGDEDIVFERFRTGSSDQLSTSGHGLGLAICRGIVEAHGGRIDARNRPDGPGAIFSFSIPVLAQSGEAGIP